MVKNRVLSLVTIGIMIAAALFMLINRLIYVMPDWVVRTIGIVVSADLAVFVYSSVKPGVMIFPEEINNIVRVYCV